MSWPAHEKETTQRLLREAILQLCRLNVGPACSYEVDGIICITKGGSASNPEEEQIVVKVHEQVSLNVRGVPTTVRNDASILREYLSSNSYAAHAAAAAGPPPQKVPHEIVLVPAAPALNLKRKANDENDNAIIDFTRSTASGDFDGGYQRKLIKCDYVNDDARRAERFYSTTSRPANTIKVSAKVPGGVLMVNDAGNESFSCGKCLLDFDSRNALELHFRQIHSGVLEFYCAACCIGFVSSENLAKHNGVVHHQTAIISSGGGHRRKQSKPRRGVIGEGGSADGDATDEEGEEITFKIEGESSPSEADRNDGSTSSIRTLLQKRPVAKLRHDDLRIDSPSSSRHEGGLGGDMIMPTMLDAGSDRMCPHCATAFADFASFSVHCRSAHHRFPCPHCLQTFTQRVNRDRHLYNHTGEKPFTCVTCGYGFTRKDALKKHQAKAHQISPCPSTSDSKNEQLNKSTGMSELSDDSAGDGDVSQNDECGLDLSMPSSSTGEYSSRAIKEEVKDPSPMIGHYVLKQQQCTDDSYSPYVVAAAAAAAAAGKILLPKSFIPIRSIASGAQPSPVGFMVSGGDWSDSEMSTRSTDPDPGSASQIPSTTVELLRHPYTDAGRQYCCDVCRVVVIGASAFESHCRMEHRRTPCVYCGKTFSQKGNMERHQRQHTGERPFACPHCSCSYTRKETLKVHINQAHPAITADNGAASSAPPPADAPQPQHDLFVSGWPAGTCSPENA